MTLLQRHQSRKCSGCVVFLSLLGCQGAFLLRLLGLGLAIIWECLDAGCWREVEITVVVSLTLVLVRHGGDYAVFWIAEDIRS